MKIVGTYLFLFIWTISLGQSKKTFKDSVFRQGDIIETPEIHFALGDNGHINDSALKKIAGFINSHLDIIFEIGVHTDSRGLATANYTLSLARANSVKDVLVGRFGVQEIQIETKGYGASFPLVNDSVIGTSKTKYDKEAFHAKNRRTELRVSSIK